MWVRICSTGAVSVMKAMMRMSAPQLGQVSDPVDRGQWVEGRGDRLRVERGRIDAVDAVLEILNDVGFGAGQEQESIRARAAPKPVIVGPTVQNIVAALAKQRVGARISGPRKPRCRVGI